MSKIIITGGTGLIGRALTNDFVNDGHEVVVMTRNPAKAKGLPTGARAAKWDGRTGNDWFQELAHAEAIINLAGETVGKPLWTAARKQRIRQSRIHAGQAIMEAIRNAGYRPNVLIQMSGAGFYGLHGDEILDESAPTGKDFLASVCVDWEGATAEAEKLGVRRVVTRTGVVLSRAGGALPLIALPFWFGVGGPLGNGQQYLPWVHIADVVKAIRFLIENSQANGVFNLCAPNPVTNKAFSQALGRAMGRPAILPAPGFALKLALGEMAELVLLGGQRVVPKRLQELGYPFQSTQIAHALGALYEHEDVTEFAGAPQGLTQQVAHE